VASRCESRLGNSCDKRKCKNQHLASFLCFSTSTPVPRQKDQPKEKRPAEKHRLALTANRHSVSVLLTEQENTLFGRWALGTARNLIQPAAQTSAGWMRRLPLARRGFHIRSRLRVPDGRRGLQATNR